MSHQRSAIGHQQKPFWILLIAASCVLIALTGCSIITRVRPPLSGPSNATPAILVDDGYEDYTGVIHVHTAYSHDADGTFEGVVRAANAQRLDFVIITEHNTLQPLRDGKQGWQGPTLILIGDEISTRGGHYVALNITEEIDRTKFTTQQVIDEVTRQGGFGFIAHPYCQHGRWKDWTVTGFTGIEGYNAAHDTLDENRLRLLLWTITAPAEPLYYSILDRPYDPLATWDELIRTQGKIVGIGSTDAHEFHVAGLTFAPYEIMFQLIRTHLLIPSPLDRRLGTTLTPDGVYDALRKGHAYFAIELTAAAKGFAFVAERHGRVRGVMGDDVDLEPDLEVAVSLPAPAQLALFRDGQLVETTTGQAWQVPVAQPGVYRVEASRYGKPWIFSNPIYIHPAPPPPPATPPAPAVQAPAAAGPNAPSN